MKEQKQSKRVMFLDYDGVVNTPIWNEKGTKCRYNFPGDDSVNNFQAVQWISEVCQKFHYDIVVTSTWRKSCNYKECLINGGLRDGINILGKTDDLWAKYEDCTRGEEIARYIEEHPEIKFYLIVDDENDFRDDQQSHFIQTDGTTGFGMHEYYKAHEIYMKDIGHGDSFWEEKEKEQEKKDN